MKFLGLIVLAALGVAGGVHAHAFPAEGTALDVNGLENYELPPPPKDKPKTSPKPAAPAPAKPGAAPQPKKPVKACPRRGGKVHVRDVLGYVIVDWKVGETYEQGEVVSYRGKHWEALRTHTSNTMNYPGAPPPSAQNWETCVPENP